MTLEHVVKGKNIVKLELSPKKSTFILNILPALRYKELDNCLPIDHKKVESYLRE